MNDTDDPWIQVQILDADRRQALAADFDTVLAEIKRFCATLLIDGELASRGALLRDVRAHMLDLFDRRLALRPVADVAALTQLVIEAHDAFTNPETAVDLRDWIQAAQPFVRRGGANT